MHITERSKSKKDTTFPIWVKSLVCADPDDQDSFIPPQCVMTAHFDQIPLVLSGSRPRSGYYKLDHDQPLAVVLRNTHFVEFPTIEVWEEFHGTIVDEQGVVTHHKENRPKRRKLDPKAGKNAITGLLGGYGTEDEADEADAHNVLALLGKYAESDDDSDEGGVGAAIEDGLGDEDTEEGETDNEVALDPGALLELLQQVQGDGNWNGEVGEDEVVDWGDSGEDEPE
jgi:hypothetical protein